MVACGFSVPTCRTEGLSHSGRSAAAEAMPATRKAIATRVRIIQAEYSALPASTAQEPVVDLDLIAAGQAVGLICHSDYRHQFGEHRIGHAGFTGRCGMGRNTVGALIGDTDRYVDQLLREWI